MLVACWCLDDEDRREALRDEERALHAAFLTSKAMWDGKALAADARAFHAKLTIPPAGQSLESAALRDALTQLDTAGRTTLAGD